jgi:hypothetical protein
MTAKGSPGGTLRTTDPGSGDRLGVSQGSKVEQLKKVRKRNGPL